MTALITSVEDRDYPGHVPTGPIGRRLADRLLASGERVRVLVPPTEAQAWPEGVELVVGDIARPDESPAAFENIDRMFLAGAAPETVRRAVTLARHGGVQHIALLSSHGPDVEITFAPDSWYWLAIEVVVERSGVPWTHLQPAPIMAQTLRDGYPDTGSDLAVTIRDHGVVREAHPDSEIPFIDEDDLAAIAATVLFDGRYAGRTLTVHGAPISLREQLRLIGRALGRNIPLEELSTEEAAERARKQGREEEEVQEILESEAAWATAATDPEHQRWVDLGIATATQVLGRPPRGYADWVVDGVDALR